MAPDGSLPLCLKPAAWISLFGAGQLLEDRARLHGWRTPSGSTSRIFYADDGASLEESS